MHQEIIQIIFGMKVGQLREARAISLKTLAQSTGMSVSYLNEIEKGKKYPKVEKMLLLAKALDAPYDELVSPKLDGSLDPLATVLASPLIQQFPFHIFGTSARELLQLMAGHPQEMGVLSRMLTELGRSYDLRMEHFFHTALRCYQMIHNNYFPELETLAESFRKDHVSDTEGPLSLKQMHDALCADGKTTVIEKDPNQLPQGLRTQRSFWQRKRQEVWLNARLSEAQRGFAYARELGYQLLGIQDRPGATPALSTTRFEDVFDNFRVSYFAGALLLPKKRLIADLKRIFNMADWAHAREALLDLTRVYGVTPETLFYRLSGIVPHFLKTKRVHFTKFSRKEGSHRLVLEKQFNMSRVHIPNGIGLNEHFCGRWLSVSLLNEVGASADGATLLEAQRSKFLDYGTEFFCMTVAFRGGLRPDMLFSVTLGFPIDQALKSTVKFWADSKIPYQELGQTCERCALLPEHCQLRQVKPDLYLADRQRLDQLDALERLLS